MKIEIISGMTKLIADNGKCLVRKGEEQKIEDNDTVEVYLAKSLTPEDYIECNLLDNLE